jgi:hypothetical protein
MNQRLSLFFAGYYAYNPALYYSQRQLISEFSELKEPDLSGVANRIENELIEAHFEPESNLRAAMSIASKFEINGLTEPGDFAGYFDWREHYTSEFEALFPMSRIDHYYFLYARKLAEVYCNVGFAGKLLKLRNEVPPEVYLERKIDKCLKDSEYIFFKLIAAAALLSSEPRQSCFNQHYRHLLKQYEQFKGMESKTIQDADSERVQASLITFSTEVENGIKECVAVLKELGV